MAEQKTIKILWLCPRCGGQVHFTTTETEVEPFTSLETATAKQRADLNGQKVVCQGCKSRVWMQWPGDKNG